MFEMMLAQWMSVGDWDGYTGDYWYSVFMTPGIKAYALFDRQYY